MEQARDIGTGGHADTGPCFLHRVCSADAFAGFEDEDPLAGAGKISGTGQRIVSRTDYDYIPSAGGEAGDGFG